VNPIPVYCTMLGRLDMVVPHDTEALLILVEWLLPSAFLQMNVGISVVASLEQMTALCVGIRTNQNTSTKCFLKSSFQLCPNHVEFRGSSTKNGTVFFRSAQEI